MKRGEQRGSLPKTLTFACDLRHGLHARPASLIAQIAEKSRSRVSVRKVGAGEADARSVLSVIALDIQPTNRWEMTVEGKDEAAVAKQLEKLVHSHFGEREGTGTEDAVMDGEFLDAPEPHVPAALKRMGIEVVPGTPASRGVGRGKLVFVQARTLSERVPDRPAQGVDAEQAKLKSALEVASDELESRMKRASGTAAELLAAHRIMLDDSEFLALIEQKIAGGMTAQCAVAHAAGAFGAKLRAAASALIRERAADVEDLATAILSAMGVELSEDTPTLDGPSILVSESITPGQLLKVEASKVVGLVLGEIGLTSHVMILARSMNVPAIVGVSGSFLKSGKSVPALIDGTFGLLAAEPPPAMIRLYDLDGRALKARRKFLKSFGDARGRSSDGASMDVGANASSAADVERAIAGGADGIGLFRTEFLYLGRTHGPTEDELVQTFAAVIRSALGKPVIFRTFDIGADKPATFLRMAREENPFLGARGARLYLKHATLLRTQLRSIVRAAGLVPGAKVRVMAPMVTKAAEIKWFREQVRAVEKNLANGGFRAEPLEVGMMVETPAAAGSIASFGKEADFFSLGTNDLAQYWFAADRGNGSVSGLVDELDAGFVAMLARAVGDAKQAGKWIGMCGEMASKPEHLPVLLGLGLNEISIAGAGCVDVKYRLAGLSAIACREMLEAVLRDGACVRTQLAAMRQGTGSTPIAEELIRLECEARSKEEAIREMVGTLFSTGRTDRPGELEEDVWAREATYSTGLGFGFAVPHCRTKAVDSVSVAVARLPRAIEWGSNDGLPVRHAFLLAVPDSVDAKASLQVLAKLARKLVHEEFRDAVERSQNAGEMAGLLKAELGL